MAKLFIVYYSRTGNTERMAKEIAKGAAKVKGVTVNLKPVAKATNEDLVDSDAIILGSPTYFRQMAAELKSYIDNSIAVYGKLDDKVGAVFTSAGTKSDGLKCLSSLYEALDCHGVNVIGKQMAVGRPRKTELTKLRALGEKVASTILK
jgi:NAD(P)H dehydrogenase (quinone)